MLFSVRADRRAGTVPDRIRAVEGHSQYHAGNCCPPSPATCAISIGILPDILNTVYIVIATLLIVLPLGVGAAIYLTEYARE